jgi:hypothetical protein
MFRKDRNFMKRDFTWRQNVNPKKTVRLHLQGGWNQRECGQDKRRGDMEQDYSEPTSDVRMETQDKRGEEPKTQ